MCNNKYGGKMKEVFYLLILAIVVMTCASANKPAAKPNFWNKDGYFVQTNIDLKNSSQGSGIHG
jgi:hypothetical protein